MQPHQDPYALIGTTFHDRYLVESFAGVGRLSAVYRATDSVTERSVGLRLLKVRGSLSPDQRHILVERMRALTNPIRGVASWCSSFSDVTDVGALRARDGRWMPVIVQTWLEGETLESVRVRERKAGAAPRSLGRTIDLLTPVADALGYAHARGLAHGGLSTRNLFVRDAAREDWRTIEILDLGVARVLATVQEKDAPFGEPSATPAELFFAASHASPEQFLASAGAIGPASDVFSLALIVSELVTGASPLGEGDHEKLRAAALDPARRPTPRALGTEVGGYVESVLARALAVNPGDRYASAAAFWDALRAAARMSVLRRSSGSLRAPVVAARGAHGHGSEARAGHGAWGWGWQEVAPPSEHAPGSRRSGVPASWRSSSPPPGFFEGPMPSAAHETNPLFAGEPRERGRAQ